MTICKYFESNPLLFGTGVILDTGGDSLGNWVELDATLLHVRGGGQKADKGWINQIPVTNVVRCTEGVIKHYLTANNGIAFGDTVSIKVDADERLTNSAWHTAGHLIANVCKQMIKGIEIVRSHQYPGEAWVGATCGELAISNVDLMGGINSELTRVIESGVAVRVYNNDLRTIEIEGFEPIPCGGTHVVEVGALNGLVVTKIKRKSGMLKFSYRLI